MSAPDSVTTWIGQLKAGDEEAVRCLWERYFARLVQLARDRLRGTARQAADEEDVALSAFHSFCQAVARCRFPQLNDRDDLWQLLLMHTARKAIDQRRLQQRLKRGGGEPAAAVSLDDIAGSEPDPQFAALVTEEFYRWLDCLEDDELRWLALRKMEGHSNSELARERDCSLRSIERKLAVIRGIWEEARDQ